jgi:hypothetical protein
VKPVTTGGLFGVTITVAEEVAEPAPLIALRVYVVLVLGATNCVPAEDVVPIPWLIETDFAPLTFHCKVAVCPCVIAEGLTSNDFTTGGVNVLKIAPFVARAIPPMVSKINPATGNAMRNTEIFFCGMVLE